LPKKKKGGGSRPDQFLKAVTELEKEKASGGEGGLGNGTVSGEGKGSLVLMGGKKRKPLVPGRRARGGKVRKKKEETAPTSPKGKGKKS